MLVHISCQLSHLKSFNDLPGLSTLTDSEATGIRLMQFVEVLEWHEISHSDDKRKSERLEVNGRPTKSTSYSYELQWDTHWIDSSSFQSSCASSNGGRPCVNVDPTTQPWWITGPRRLGGSTAGAADGLQAGAFLVPSDMAAQIGTGRPLVPSCDAKPCPPTMDAQGGRLYWRNLKGRTVASNVDFPGDVRLSYTLFNASQVLAWSKRRE